VKILHINSYYGGGMFYKNLYDKQVKNGLNIDVFVPTSNDENLTLDLGEYTTISKNHTKYDRLFFHLKHKKIFKDIIQKFDITKFNLTHAHSLFSNGFIALRLKEDFGIPYVVAVRNTDVNIFFKNMIHLRKLGIKILHEADKIIFLSESYKDNVLKNYVPCEFLSTISSKVEIIPNGIDEFWLKNKGEIKKIIDRKKIKIIYAGELSKNKNLTTTTKAIEILQSREYSIEFTIVGKAKEKNIYQKLKKLTFVNYIPPVSKEKLIEIYRENHVFVMPSITETFGLVYPEAMSQGLPIIYSKGQGFDGQFTEGLVGYRVNSTDDEEIANRIIDIIENYEIISNNCISLVNKFEWGNLTKEYEKIYKMCIDDLV
jgi:glycosyltransferase involved in cell wall biosynthesis